MHFLQGRGGYLHPTPDLLDPVYQIWPGSGLLTQIPVDSNMLTKIPHSEIAEIERGEVPRFGFRIPGVGFQVPGFLFRIPRSGFQGSCFGYRGLVRISGIRVRVSGCTEESWSRERTAPVFPTSESLFTRVPLFGCARDPSVYPTGHIRLSHGFIRLSHGFIRLSAQDSSA